MFLLLIFHPTHDPYLSDFVATPSKEMGWICCFLPRGFGFGYVTCSGQENKAAVTTHQWQEETSQALESLWPSWASARGRTF